MSGGQEQNHVQDLQNGITTMPCSGLRTVLLQFRKKSIGVCRTLLYGLIRLSKSTVCLFLSTLKFVRARLSLKMQQARARLSGVERLMAILKTCCLWCKPWERCGVRVFGPSLQSLAHIRSTPGKQSTAK